jgi:D-glycero-D-manno-heptose 1,7-bisphosphate phosphatase
MTKTRALLLDRDGIINIDHGYVGKIGDFEFMPGIFAFLRAARDRGYLLAILTNQAGVARGFYGVEDYHRLTAHMLKELKREGIEIDLTLACFEHSEGTVSEFTRTSFWRKPNPGMVCEAIRRLRCDPARSAFLGDALRDMQAGLAGGIGKNLWLTQDNPEMPVGVTRVKNFDEALKFL